MPRAFFTMIAGLLALNLTNVVGFAQLDELTRKQAEFVQKLRRAEGAVNSFRQEVRRQQKIVNQESKILESAQSQVEMAEKEVRIRATFLSSIKFGRNDRERHLLKVLSRYNEQITELEDQHNSGNLNASQKQAILNQLRPLYTQRSQIQRQINRIKRDSHLAERKRNAEVKLREARDKLAQAKRGLVEPQSNVDSANEFLRGLRQSLQKAIDKRADLRLAAGAELHDLEPAYLKKIRVLSADKSKIFYEAEWTPEQDRIKKKIEFVNQVIQEQQTAVSSLESHRLDLAYELSEVNEKWQALNNQYIDLIGSEMWENIGVELGASAASILWNKKGTIVTNLFVESGSRVRDWFMGYNRPSFDFPKVGSSASNRKSKNAFDSLYSADKLQANLAALASRYVADEGVENAVKKSGAWAAFQGAINRTVNDQTQDLLSNIRLAERMNQMAFGDKVNLSRFAKSQMGKIGADTLTNIAKSAAIDQAKNWLREHIFTSGKERIKVYEQMFEYDLLFQAIIHDLRAAQFRSRNEENKLAAANQLRDQLLAELDNSNTKRFLNIKKDEIIKTTNNKAILLLEFSHEVRDVKVRMSQFESDSSTIGSAVELELDLDGLPDIAELIISAKHACSLKDIDSKPRSVATFNTQTKSWHGYESGNDKSHRVRLQPLGNGVSLVFLFDCSGSMKDNNKLEEAKAAAKRILQDESLFRGKSNEVALWVFVGGFPRLVEEFTADTNTIVEAIDSLSANGGTPLARSIMEAGEYLVEESKFKRKALVVLSDGEDTENGNPQYAIQRIKEKSTNVRREGW